MAKENNKMQVDIDTLKKQNVNDLLSIKELYKRIEELGEKTTQIKYIDNTIVKKLKKEYEKLKKIILDENIQAKLSNDIKSINSQQVKLTNDIKTINSQQVKSTNDIKTINSQLNNITNKIKKIYLSDYEDELTNNDWSIILNKIIEGFNVIPENTTNYEIYFDSGNYNFNSVIKYKSNIRFVGATNGGTLITSINKLNPLFENIDDDIKNVEWIDLTFLGGALEKGELPQRERECESGIFTVIKCHGNLYTGYENEVNNINITRCKFLNIESLPVYFAGGKNISMSKNLFYNCYDVGFIYCNNIDFCNNNIKKSSDNGVSISRGCKNVVCNNNIIDLSALSGIFLAGFNGEQGVKNFTCSGNVITKSGLSGINMEVSPCNGVVSANLINKVYRGEIGKFNVSGSGYGIKIRDGASGGLKCENLNINNNTIIDCERVGILAQGVKYSQISGNTITNCGSKYGDDGTSVVDLKNLSTETNIGLYLVSSGRNLVANNIISDTRSEKLTIFPIRSYNSNNNMYDKNTAFDCLNNVDVGLRDDDTPANNNLIDNTGFDLCRRTNYLPTPSEVIRGKTFCVFGDEGVEDKFYVCKKKQDGKYGWYRLDETV